jgi:hypothetical protein
MPGTPRLPLKAGKDSKPNVGAAAHGGGNNNNMIKRRRTLVAITNR